MTSSVLQPTIALPASCGSHTQGAILMEKIKELAGEKVHTRSITIATRPLDGDRILVEGELVDTRLTEYFLLSGEKKEPGVLHRMTVRLLCEGARLKILNAEAVMPGIPREECGGLAESVKSVIGLSISAGFTAKLKSAMGGVKGCYHLLSLINAMAPAAVQGYWSNRARKPLTVRGISAKDAMKYLPLNSCYVWREDGPMVKQIVEEICRRK